MDKDEKTAQLQFTNEPMQPPRDGIIGEHVFRAAWQAYLADDGTGRRAANYKLACILERTGYPVTERSATVAASVICYLGCRRGVDLLDAAERLGRSAKARDLAYFHAWSAHNGRDSAVNSGCRSLELILTPPGVPPSRDFATLEDFEVADQVMRWLGSDIGQKFLAACEAEIKRQEHVVEFERHMTVNLNMSPFDIKHTLRLAADYATEPVPFAS